MTTTKTTTALMFAPLLAVAVAAHAQTPAEAPAPGPAPAVAAPPLVAPPPVAPIPIGTRVGVAPTDYQGGDRRDPFASLIAPRANASAPAGTGRAALTLPDLALADVTVRGVIRSGDRILAILEGPNRKSFVAHLNDKLRDASVQSIDTAGVVFAEAVSSGMRPITVRKTIRPAGEGIQ